MQLKSCTWLERSSFSLTGRKSEKLFKQQEVIEAKRSKEGQEVAAHLGGDPGSSSLPSSA